MIVWNGEDADGPGGTVDFVRRLGHRGPGTRVAVVDTGCWSCRWEQGLRQLGSQVAGGVSVEDHFAGFLGP